MGLRARVSLQARSLFSYRKKFQQFVSTIISCFSKELFRLDSIKHYVSIFAPFSVCFILKEKNNDYDPFSV